MKRKRKKMLQRLGLVLLLVISLTALTGPVPVKAASADIFFSVEDAEVSVGDSVVVLLQITADETVGDFEGYLTYDSALLEYVSGPACITGGDGYLRVYDMDAQPSDYLRSYSMEFKALKHGVCQFEMSSAPMVYAYENGNSMSVMAEPFSFKIAAAQTASSNADIQTLRISPGKLVPDFSPETTEYEVELPAGTDRLIVSAVAQELIANVQVLGNENLVSGKNEVRVVVTAEDGTEKTYRIWATVEASAPETEPTAAPEQEEKQLYLEQADTGMLLCGNYRYRLAEDVSGVEIPEGYERTELFIDGSAVTVYQKAGQEEFCLLVLENLNGEKGIYRFDRNEYTIQRYQPETIVITTDNGESQKLNELLVKTREYEENLNRMSLIVGAVGAIAVLLFVMIIRMFVRSRSDDDEE